MICPNCEAEFVEGITTCSDCGTGLIANDEFIKEDDDNLVSLEDWKVVYSTHDIIEAEMMKSNLSGAEIEAIVFSKEDRMRLNLSFAGSAPIKIYVREESVEEAKRIINEINNTEVKDEDEDGQANE